MEIKLNVRAVLDRVIVMQVEAPEKEGVLILADTAKKQPKRGVVLVKGPGAIGSDNSYLPMLLNEGDTIGWSEYAGQEDVINGHKVWIVNYGDILWVE
jgi:chaperonin GroES